MSRCTRTILSAATGMRHSMSRSLRFSPCPFFLPCLFAATSASPQVVAPSSAAYSRRLSTRVSSLPSSRVNCTMRGRFWKRVSSPGSRSTRVAPGEDTSDSISPASSSPSRSSSPAMSAREKVVMSSSDGEPYSSSSLSSLRRSILEDGTAANAYSSSPFMLSCCRMSLVSSSATSAHASPPVLICGPSKSTSLSISSSVISSSSAKVSSSGAAASCTAPLDGFRLRFAAASTQGRAALCQRCACVRRPAQPLPCSTAAAPMAACGTCQLVTGPAATVHDGLLTAASAGW
mmetsp:Transcript_30328/g.76426  ORF Transcript_30328/g.76426 Transcript_30328/m.76426 type:complete len:290 (-) Transcript_30328:153-1022(-)